MPSVHVSSQSDSSASVIITGYGLVTPLGHSAWETFAQLLAGKTTADRLAKLMPGLPPADVAQAVGGVNIAVHSGDPAIELAERAAREALFMANQRQVGDAQPPIPIQDTCFIMGSSKGAVHTLIAAADGVNASHTGRPVTRLGLPAPKDAPLAVALGPHGYLSHHLARRLGCGPMPQVVGACASSLIALHQARLLLTHESPAHRPQRVVVLTSEAALHELFIASYRRLGVIPPLTADADGRYAYRCLPLDESRQGFILGQMGAAVVLERADDPASLPPGSLVLADTAHASDSHDIIRSDPAMAALSHVAQRLLRGRAADVIHAHATGTREHDEMELRAYAPLLAQPSREHATDVYAVKGALGHGLGAAGLVSTVIACMCAKANRRPPMPWLTRPVQPPCAQLSVNAQRQAVGEIRTQAIFAAGFGGHVAGAVVEKVGR